MYTRDLLLTSGDAQPVAEHAMAMTLQHDETNRNPDAIVWLATIT